MDLISLTSYVVGFNFRHAWRDLQFNIDSEQQIFEKFFYGNFIFSQSFCQKSAERKSPKECFLNILFCCLTCDTNLGFASNKPTHYLLHYSDFYIGTPYLEMLRSIENATNDLATQLLIDYSPLKKIHRPILSNKTRTPIKTNKVVLMLLCNIMENIPTQRFLKALT